MNLAFPLLAVTLLICWWSLCKQFEPRSGQTECRSWSGSKPFDTLMVFLKEFFKKVHLKKVSRWQKPEKLPACRSWSGSKPFDTLIVFLKEFFKIVHLKKVSRWVDDKSVKNYLHARSSKVIPAELDIFKSTILIIMSSPFRVWWHIVFPRSSVCPSRNRVRLQLDNRFDEMIFWWNFIHLSSTLRWHAMHKNHKSCLYIFQIIPLET